MLDASVQGVSQAERRVGPFVLAAERLLDQEFAVLQKIGPELATGTGELVERVQVDVARELGDDASG